MRQRTAPAYPYNVITQERDAGDAHVPERKVRQSEEPKLRHSYHSKCRYLSDRCELQHLRA